MFSPTPVFEASEPEPRLHLRFASIVIASRGRTKVRGFRSGALVLICILTPVLDCIRAIAVAEPMATEEQSLLPVGGQDRSLRKLARIASQHVGEGSLLEKRTGGSSGSYWLAKWGRPRHAFVKEPDVPVPGMAGEERLSVMLLRFRKQALTPTIRVHASFEPPQDGWQCFILFEHPWTSVSSKSRFDVLWRFLSEDGVNSPYRGRAFSVERELSFYHGHAEFEDIVYRVSLKLTDRSDSKTLFTTDEIKRWYASPESLRDAALERLRTLRAKAADTISAPGGAPGYEKVKPFRLGGVGRFSVGSPSQKRTTSPTISFVNLPAPRRSNRPLKEEELRQLIDDAHSELDRRIAFIRKHHRDLHAALLKTFPLNKAFD
jgi:hypothetical protein